MNNSIMYHGGNRRLQDQFNSRRISDRLEEKLTHEPVHRRRQDNRRERSIFLFGDSRCRRAARLLL